MEIKNLKIDEVPGRPKNLLKVAASTCFFFAFIFGAPLVSPTFERLQMKIVISLSCRVGTLSYCESIFAKYQNSKWVDLVEKAGVLVCERGSLRGCMALGRFYNRQHRTDSATTVFSKACRMQNAEGCASFAAVEQVRDPANALKFAQRACVQGNAYGCLLWGRVGKVIRDLSTASYGFHYGCFRHSISEACNHLAELYLEAKQKDRALEALQKGCQDSNQRACERLAGLLPSNSRMPSSVR